MSSSRRRIRCDSRSTFVNAFRYQAASRSWASARLVWASMTESGVPWLARYTYLAGGVNTGLYTVMKHALVGYGEMLRHELAPERIGVSILCPGLVESNLGSTSARQWLHRRASSGIGARQS